MSTAARFPLAPARRILAEFRGPEGVAAGLRPRAIQAVILLTLGALAGLVTPRLLGELVDLLAGHGDAVPSGMTALLLRLSGNSPAHTTVLGIGVMVIATVAGAMATARGFRACAEATEIGLARLRERMLSHALSLPLERVERAGTGDLVTRSGDDIAHVSTAVTTALPALTTGLFTIVIAFGAVAALDWRFAIVLLITIPLYVLALRFYLDKAPAVYELERAAMSERARVILQAVRGASTIRAFRADGPIRRDVEAWSWESSRTSIDGRILTNLLSVRLAVSETVGFMGLLLLGFVLSSWGEVSVGAVTTALLFFQRLFRPLNQILREVDVIQSAATSLSRIVGVLTVPTDAAVQDSIPDVVPAASASPGTDAASSATETTGCSLALESVTFSYPPPEDTDATASEAAGPGVAVHSTPVIDGLDLGVEAGATVALVGGSGTGKSTVAALLAGLRRPDTGRILIDGRDATWWSDVERSRYLVLVTQEVHVFSGTLRDDLLLVAPRADDDTLWVALDAVGAAAWVRALSDGLDTYVGASGHSLSPAKAQQLALARVILADPPSVILDEAGAEAGSTDAAVLEGALAEVARGRTAIVVAHHLDQAAAADRVIVLEGGRIVDDGPHDVLTTAGGPYARLWESWCRGGGKDHAS